MSERLVPEPATRSLLDGPAVSASAPAWWQEKQKAGWTSFQSLPMPKRKDEDWRFAGVQALSLDAYGSASPLSATLKKEIIAKSVLSFDSAASFVFGNDELLSTQALPAELVKAGVTFKPISQALAEEPELLQKHFMSQPVALGSQKFFSLHAAFCRNGVLVHIPKGVKVEIPLVAFHWLAGENSSVFPHTLILAEEDSQVTVVDVLNSFDDSRGFACSVNDLILSRGAKVDYVCIQEWSHKVTSFQINATSVARQASAKTLNLNLGGAFARVESQSLLVGEEARSEMLALSVPAGKQEMDHRTLQRHIAPHTWSDLLYKNALSHRSKTIFKGLIQVDHGAQFTDAYQTNRNLLLNPTAEADSMPGLEILNDDVKCSHGATTGQVEEELMFYFLARGISADKARELLVFGFFEEVLTRLGHEKISDDLRERIKAKFARVPSMLPAAPTEPEVIADPTDVPALQG